MRPTPRFWHVGSASAFLAGLGIVAQQPVAVLGGLGLASWLLVGQYTATREFQQATDKLTVDVNPVRNSVVVDEELSITAEVILSSPARAAIELSVELPPGAAITQETSPTLSLEPGETVAATTFSCSFPVAGMFDVPPATVRLENSQQTVTETVPVETDERLRVDPRQPRSLHVGQGGERISAYGEHPAGTGAGGLIPEESRQYVPGDSLDQIDWKATARMQSPHVRDFETETDRKTIIAVDHSQGMVVGPPGQTMLDYAREVALGYARAAESFDDPLGLYAIGDHGVTVQQSPTTSPVGYQHLRNALHDLEPTQSETSPTSTVSSAANLTRPSEARSGAHQLAGEDSAFAETVQPFLADTDAYIHRIESDPLFESVRRILAETSGQLWLVLLTTDTGGNRLRDTASLVSSNNGNLSLFLTPRVLFEPGAMADLTEAYDRYASFESFRRTITRNPRTEAYELGPGDRLDALLASRRRRTD
ncbi:MAG: DUF58 domain-containing protein [Halolamina sp.]|uniref:DUF58 domain-containing protein n=1 Tax=Halolamina sp. TaxID=1940283 RepID=UPI002FC2B586